MTLILTLVVLAGCAAPSPGTSRLKSITGQWIEVQRGDTLGAIARRAGVPVERLSRFNPDTDPDRLLIGQRLLVPTQQERAPRDGPYRYQVRPGDTYTAIAQHFDTRTSRIQKANPRVEPTQLAVGQLIQVPLAKTSSRPSSSTPQKPETPAVASTSSPESSDDNEPPDNTQDWSWPLDDYRIERDYGKNQHGTLQPMLLATTQGAHARAVADGDVKFAGSMRQLGRVVIIHHPNNLQSVYAQCDTLDVDAGSTIEQNSPVCKVARNNVTQRYDLLFDMRRGGKPMDPQRLLP
ncbi:M23 family metallopeptidase [Aidingimonas halophila]|uniref:M23 family metallopeptidase n=1 Tax=Aidingimonas halophila TaxID=574349 RepID=UPI000AE57E04|nr:M23 family metallopeptidase [Aidingimonas halophila]GHC27213.1 peptidoglycan-binding protein [Aidingimonas halophila]